MKSICLFFQVHQPFRLRKFRFFDIGKESDYFDDFQNNYILKRVAEKCYLPMNQLLLDLINEYGARFKVSFSISGTAIDQFHAFAPEVLDSFKKLAKTGSVEFLAETDAHSLSSLKSNDEFKLQVKTHMERIKKLFGKTPTVFRNTEMIYSDEIGAAVADMGFKAMLTEGAKHILGWKSPNYVFTNAINPKLKVLLRNFRLSDDIAFRFSNKGWSDWPLSVEKYVGWLKAIKEEEQVINIFLDYETFGEHQWVDSGIFDFMRALPGEVFKNPDFSFHTPSEIADNYQPVAKIHVPYPVSWADEERDLTAWIGNELQDDAFEKLYELEAMISKCSDKSLKQSWRYLQTSDHFYYMSTKWFSDGEVHKYFNPYGSPYDAYINYMNVLSDFEIRLKKCATQRKAKK
jgi:alpha-amylase